MLECTHVIRFIVHIHRRLILLYNVTVNTFEFTRRSFIVLEYHGYPMMRIDGGFNFCLAWGRYAWTRPACAWTRSSSSLQIPLSYSERNGVSQETISMEYRKSSEKPLSHIKDSQESRKTISFYKKNRLYSQIFFEINGSYPTFVRPGEGEAAGEMLSAW